MGAFVISGSKVIEAEEKRFFISGDVVYEDITVPAAAGGGPVAGSLGLMGVGLSISSLSIIAGLILKEMNSWLTIPL